VSGQLGAAGTRYEPISRDRLEARLLAADKPGEHIWVMVGAWILADPSTAADPSVIKLMDRENLIQFSGPGCFKCEKPYSAKMAKRRCLGSLDLQ
jgi:hypothetical protein